MVEKLEDLETEIKQELCQFLKKKHQIINEIESLDNHLYVELLYKRYVEYESLWDISSQMNFSYEYIKHLHGYALQDFAYRFLKHDTK